MIPGRYASARMQFKQLSGMGSRCVRGFCNVNFRTVSSQPILLAVTSSIILFLLLHRVYLLHADAVRYFTMSLCLMLTSAAHSFHLSMTPSMKPSLNQKRNSRSNRPMIMRQEVPFEIYALTDSIILEYQEDLMLVTIYRALHLAIP